MKSKYIKIKPILLINALFLTLFSCSNPVIEQLIKADEETKRPGSFSAVTYTVDFESDGGSPVDSLTVAEGEKATRPENPEKSGFGFVNWYDNGGLTEPHYDFDTPVTGDITLYAKWSKTVHRVIFMDGETELYSQSVGEGGTASKPVPTKEGHTFDGWYSDPELTALYDFETPVTGGFPLYAKWTLNTYTVTFMDGGTVLAGLTRNAIPHGSTVSRPGTDPAKDNYTFDDWYSNSGLTTLFSFSTPVTDNTTVYAKFNINTYTVTFMDGDTPLSELTQTVAHGSPVNRPPDPTKDGFGFVNWYSDSDLAVLYDFDAPVSGGFPLYAKWIILITDVDDIAAYLAEHPANTAANPVPLYLKLDLGTMSVSTSNWQGILRALNTAGKFVRLDLSACTISGGTGTEFNPAYTVSSGKNRIISMALPDIAIRMTNCSTATGYSPFTVLESFSGKGLTAIGDRAFYSHTNLKQTALPEGVISIGNNAFYNCTNLTLISLPAGLTTIGNNAFQSCSNLALTSLPEGVITIGSEAFNSCTKLALTSLPAGVTTIGSATFQRCSDLALISLPAGLTTIGANAFSGCSNIVLTSLPEGVTSIGNSTFFGCTKLALTSLPAGVTTIGISAFQGCTKLAWTSLPEKVTSIGSQAFMGCSNLALTSLPEKVTSIGNSSTFENCTSLTQFTLHAGITNIGNTTFRGCINLALVTSLRETPPTLGTNVFATSNTDTAALPNLRIEVPEDSVAAYKTATNWKTYESRIFPISTVTNIENITAYLAAQPVNTADNPVPLRLMLDLGTMTNADSNWRQLLTALDTAGKFVNLDLSACTIDGGSTTAFNPDYSVTTGKNRIVSIILPDTATSIVNAANATQQAFRNFTALKTFSGTGLTSIGTFAFYQLTNLDLTSLPEGLISIAAQAFQGCTNLALTSLPEGLTSIGNHAFNGCTKLAITSLPEGLTSVNGYAFFNCTSLTRMRLHAGITSVSYGAFYDCTNLATVTCLRTTPPTLGTVVFDNTHAGLRIEVPAGSVAAYKANSTWKTYADRIFAIEE